MGGNGFHVHRCDDCALQATFSRRPNLPALAGSGLALGAGSKPFAFQAKSFQQVSPYLERKRLAPDVRLDLTMPIGGHAV